MSTEPITLLTAKKCTCAVCIFMNEAEYRINALPIEHQEYFNTLLDNYLEVSADLDYWKAKAKGQI